MMGQTPVSTHDALFYASDAELVEAAAPFLRAGLDGGERAIVVCGEHTTTLLRDALDNDERIDVLPRGDVYRRPPGTVATYSRAVEGQVATGAPGIRLVAEIDFRGRPEHCAEWLRYEAVVNHAFAALPFHAVCLYDTRALPRQVLDGAELTHPSLLTTASRVANPRYVDPAEYLRRTAVNGYHGLATGSPALRFDAVTDLALLRHDLRATLAASGLTEAAADPFVLAVNEVASNAVLYGAPPVQVRLWSTSERTLCTVTDHGSGFDDPFAGYLYAANGTAESGRGLWLARQVCDAVETEPEADGFSVHLLMRH